MTDQALIETALASRDYQVLVEVIDQTDTCPSKARARRFASNMLALYERDHALASEIEDAPTTGRVRLSTTPDGAETLTLTNHPGKSNPLCPGGSRKATLDHATAELAKQPDPSKSIALAGIGDGAVLDLFSQELPDIVGRSRVVFVVEPDAELFRSALMLHDWSMPTGPLRHGRFRLAVGKSWQDRLSRDITPDSRLPAPATAVKLCSDPREIASSLANLTNAVLLAAKNRRRQSEELYRSVTPQQISERLSSISGARIMLLTTRYSTVLQHSTRNFASAAQELGAIAHVSIESEPWQQHTISSLLGETVRFRPDIVLQIDHHRHETPGVFPNIVPFVCIIQDNLLNLMSRAATTKLGPTDFSTGAWIRRYVLDYDYPESRCIEIPRLTSKTSEHPSFEVPSRSLKQTRCTTDLLYVSNHSSDPADAVEHIASALGRECPNMAQIVRASGQDLITHYEQGGCIEDELDLARFISDSCSRRDLRPPTPDQLTAVTDQVNVTINNPLYRQQGLRWAITAARELGLTFALYGRGWDEHPEFEEFAQGPIDYNDLPEASRAARFCLTLEPYFPTMHQRSLDTWMWGGLPLIRIRRHETQQLEFNAWLRRLPRSVRTFDAAIQYLNQNAPEHTGAFRDIHERQQGIHAWDGSGDLVALYRRRADESCGDLMELPPRFDEIAFSNQSKLVATIRTLMNDEQATLDIRREQHEWVRPRFSYELGMERILRTVARRMPGVS